VDTWELFSIALVAAVVGLFSGPRAALTKSIRSCTFEVFVEIVDRMNWSLAPALTVLLPAAFLSLSLAVLMSYHELPELFFLNVTALLLFLGALIVAIVFELPISAGLGREDRRTDEPGDGHDAVRSLSGGEPLISVCAGHSSSFA
jgi:uncharacterized membrane protein